MVCSFLQCAFSRAAMEYLDTKCNAKQEPFMLMKPKEEEDHEEEEAVSTELALRLDYQPPKKKPRMSIDDHIITHGDNKEQLLKTNDSVSSTNQDLVTRDYFMDMPNINNNEVDSSCHIPVSTDLELFCDPWKIKKKLTGSDLNGLSRLLIHSSSVKRHIFPFMCVDDVKQVESSDGLRVCVWDHDTDSMHQLVFKKWSSSKAYVLSLKWRSDFVKRRGLKLGDQIGLYWDHHHSRFGFSVLHRIDG